jgi:hypothetical protein
VIEQMSVDDYQLALRPKVQGTQNLNTAFGSSLDFFIMLSSCASILGNKGQANYAAGNAFQDAFAYSKSDDQSNFVALNLGIIEDAGVLSLHSDTLRSLLRQGYFPVRHEELLALLEYAMSDQCRQDRCHQAIIGFNGRSIFNAEVPPAVSRNPLLSHLTYTTDMTVAGETGIVSENVKQLIAAASTNEEIHRIIVSAIA